MPILGIMASQISGHLWAPEGAYDSLATVTLSTATTTVTFTGIPSGYKHLQIRGFWKGNRATYPVSGTNMTFNSDTGSNYAFHNVIGTGSVAQSGGAGSQTAIDVGQPGTSVTNYAASIIDILDYSSTTKYKTARILAGLDLNGTIAGYGGAVGLYSGVWLNTSAVTSISFNVSDGSQWQQYSQFALYGIK